MLEKAAPQGCNGRDPPVTVLDLETTISLGNTSRTIPIRFTRHALFSAYRLNVRHPDFMFCSGVWRHDSKLDFPVVETSYASSLARDNR
jgi:hypothetical protein